MSLEALLVKEPFRRKIKSPQLSWGIITAIIILIISEFVSEEKQISLLTSVGIILILYIIQKKMGKCNPRIN